ncbi:hypothetical protein F4553_007873 [Allocatelliglobosispora scoriae]|uniref:Uncharacterized protein n=1 Tax=Allocatelliglobosispora scoriae TaxID=643052 RepID=A0A841C570_9ACTN|nr:hypothetical protein [Allocatelliglobosispora scoriae]MBB5874439.1 hypothetical protein [Allocatelliglobosispora scoriae]
MTRNWMPLGLGSWGAALDDHVKFGEPDVITVHDHVWFRESDVISLAAARRRRQE